jgi:hypothetical protein
MQRFVRLSVAVAAIVLALGGNPSPGDMHAQAQDYSNVVWLSQASGGASVLPTDNTVPHWSSSFALSGVTYPFTMVGTDPSTTQTATTVPVEIIPLRLVFADGVARDATDIVSGALGSPIFQQAPFTSGTTQFGDAVLRATFWNQVQSTNWHVLLGTPTIYPTVTIDVPANLGESVLAPQVGLLVGAVNSDTWFNARLVNVINSLHLSARSLPIFLLRDAGTLFKGGQCCIAGEHVAAKSLNGNGQQQVQTYLWASWGDPGSLPPVQPFLGVQDVFVLSHEVSEWLNDPFVNNLVPPWPFALGGCQGNLETGDAVEYNPSHDYPLTLDGFTYNLQNEALLPWFARQNPSTAIGGVYSYPDTSVLTSPAPAC